MQRLELALETISPKSDPFAYSILSLVTDWWYAIRSCSSTSVKERSACTKKIVKNLSKQVETNVYSTFFPNLLQGDMSEEGVLFVSAHGCNRHGYFGRQSVFSRPLSVLHVTDTFCAHVTTADLASIGGALQTIAVFPVHLMSMLHREIA